MLVDDYRLKQLKNLEEKIGYEFKNIEVINRAFIHRSYSNENSKQKNENYERLEFLGDAVLDLTFSDLLLKAFPKTDEGDLTKLRSKLVREESFSKMSDILELSGYLLLGKGELKSGGLDKPSIKADIFEAFFGAIYLESNFDIVKDIISKLFKNEIENIKTEKAPINSYKVMLQEYLSSKEKSTPKYVLDKEEGMDHEKTFFMSVFKEKTKLGEGFGKNKKEAEQNAAKSALEKLKLI